MIAGVGILGYVQIMTDQINKATKPPTQGVGVAGFRADVYAADEKKIDYQWHHLIHFPPFQMFACEKMRLGFANTHEWIMGFVNDQINVVGQEEFFKNYSEWHDAKGYWKHEDVYGNLKEES